MRRTAAVRHLNGVNVSKMAIRPSVTIPAVVVPSPQQSWQVFSGTNVALFDFLPRGATINSECYCHVLSDVHTRLQIKRPGLITKGVLFLQDNARAHTAHRTMCTLQQLGWEVLPHPPYCPDQVPRDFHLFGPLKEFLGGQHFNTDDEVKQAVLGWFSHTDKSFYAEAFQALVKRWDKCINVAGGHVEK